MNKHNVGHFLLPLVATRQVRQGGYLHKNIFDVLSSSSVSNYLYNSSVESIKTFKKPKVD